MINILIVDDYEEWRRQIGFLFRVRPELRVIGEASDGLEAVQKAEELKPDLVLLDIGLSKLNGIEVARRLRELRSNAKIIFLSQDNSLDAVCAAMGTGANGYVYKAHAGSELLAAVEAVLRGERYLSGRLKNCEFSEVDQDSSRHTIFYCSDDSCLLDIFTRTVEAALNNGNAAIVLATELH
jgi:DNA-binding NarL/FixJ family response regulator